LFPDLSDSLDGHLGLKQGALSSGGISIEDIENLGDSKLVITIGNSVKNCGQTLLKKNEKIQHLHFDTLGGLLEADEFYKQLCISKDLSKPHPKIIKWRKRLQDALLDTHFAIGGTKVVIAAEPDQILSISKVIKEAGAYITAAVSPTKSPSLDKVQADKIIIGDMEDVEKELIKADFVISNFHCERLAKKYDKAFIIRGFPNYEIVGNQLKNDLLYEGSSYFLFEIANIINHHNCH
jgi:nitrogenase molybdenum-iron protein NifN